LLQETAKRIEGIGADVMLQSPSAQIFLTFSGSPMPIKIADKLREMKYIKAVTPALLQFNSSGGVETIWGIDPGTFRDVSGGFIFLQGRDMQGPNDMLIDDWQAKAKHMGVGNTYNLLNRDWTVVGIVEHGKAGRIFVPLTTLQEMVGARDKASIFLVKCTRAEHTEDVIQEMKDSFPGYPVRPLKDFMTLMTSTNIPGLQTFINAMIALAISIGLLVIFLTMYTTVLERTRDIGVLKSLGASKLLIVRSLLTETAALCLLGVVAGVALSYLFRAVLLFLFPTLSVLITPDWILRAGLIALIGALVGASYPAWVATRKDVVESLSYD
jgi:putative ABC transport system permease protein